MQEHRTSLKRFRCRNSCSKPFPERSHLRMEPSLRSLSRNQKWLCMRGLTFATAARSSIRLRASLLLKEDTLLFKAAICFALCSANPAFGSFGSCAVGVCAHLSVKFQSRVCCLQGHSRHLDVLMISQEGHQMQGMLYTHRPTLLWLD